MLEQCGIKIPGLVNAPQLWCGMESIAKLILVKGDNYGITCKGNVDAPLISNSSMANV